MDESIPLRHLDRHERSCIVLNMTRVQYTNVPGAPLGILFKFPELFRQGEEKL